MFGGIWTVVSEQKNVLSAAGAQCEIITGLSPVLGCVLGSRNRTVLYVVHGFSDLVVLAALIASSLSRNAIFIWQPHAHRFEAHRRPFLARFFFATVGRNFAGRAKTIISVSPLESQLLIDLGIPEKKIFTLPNFIEEKKVEIVKSKIDKEIKNLSATPYCLTVARDEPNKNLDRLHASLDCLVECGVTPVLICPNLKEEHEDPRLNVFNYVAEKQLVKLIHGAEFLIVTSKFEAFSLVSLRALSLRVPVFFWENLGLESYSVVSNGFIRAEGTVISKSEVAACLQTKEAFGALGVEKNLDFFSGEAFKRRFLKIVGLCDINLTANVDN